MKSRRASALVLTGAVGLAGLGVGAAIGPATASAATTQAVGDRLTAIKNALAGLVKGGTLTQAQADKVATTLDSTLPKGGFGPGFGPGWHHGGGDLETPAGVIGVTADELRTALQSGKTLAQVAQSKGISQATLVDKLVAAEKSRIAAAVKAGRLTQAQADAITADLKTRITERVTSTGPGRGRGPGQGPGGHVGPGWGGPQSSPGTPGAPSPPSPSNPPSPSTSGSTS